MSTLVATVRSLATYVAVSLYILVLGPPLLLWTLISGRPHALYRIGAAGATLGLWLSGIRVRVRNGDAIQHDRAAVYAINHTSNVEPPIVFKVLSGLFPRLRILYKAELRKLPILVRAFDVVGFVPLERGNREQSLPAIERAVQALRDGNSFLIFPEGTRSRTGELLPFKKGGFIMAIKAQAPVVPVAISGARKAMRKGSPIIRPVDVIVAFGDPIPTVGLTLDDRDALVARSRAAVAELLEQNAGRRAEGGVRKSEVGSRGAEVGGRRSEGGGGS
jgi:1-acyl-sn-glycerol-3-phosphate acyltransferase